jgi:RNA polymerase sigma factor (sigma-70 family)
VDQAGKRCIARRNAGDPSTGIVPRSRTFFGRHSSRLSPLDYGDSEDSGELHVGEEAAGKADPRNPEQTTMGRQLGRVLEQGLARLSNEHRAVLELAFAQRRSYREIAAITGCPVNTVNSRMFYARKNLAQFLASQGVSGYANNRN